MAKIKKEINITASAKYSQVEKLKQRLGQTQNTLRKFTAALVLANPVILKLAEGALKAATVSDRQETLAELIGLIGQDAAPKLMQALDKLGTQGYDALHTKVEAAGEVMSDSAIRALARTRRG